MSLPVQDLVSLAQRLADGNPGDLTFILEHNGAIRVESYADHHAAAQAYVSGLGRSIAWSTPVVLDDGSVWRRLSAVVDGITFLTFDCRASVECDVAA